MLDTPPFRKVRERVGHPELGSPWEVEVSEHPGPQVRGTWGTRIVLGWRRANTGISPLRRKSAPSVEMTDLLVGLAGEEVFDLLDEYVAAHVADGFG